MCQSERRLAQIQQSDCFRAGLVLPKALILIGLFAGVFIKIASVNYFSQASAGVRADAACQNCSELLKSMLFTRSVLNASKAMTLGTAFNRALIKNNLVLTPRVKQVLLTSDHSGAHQAEIEKELAIQSQSLKLKSNNFLKWTPKFFYLLAFMFINKMAQAL